MFDVDSEVKQVLNQIYSSLAFQVESDSQPLSPDDFRMYVYKVVPCTRRGPHSWVECSYCHPGEKAGRRCPQKHCYVPITCPDMKKDAQCPRGDACMFAHNVFEYWLHPARYRTQLCSYGMECKRGICFFAHHPGEMRIHPASPQLLALEKELEASDPSFAAPNPNACGKQHMQQQGSPSDSVSRQQQAMRHQRQPESSPTAHMRQAQYAFSGQAAQPTHQHMGSGYSNPNTPRPVHHSAAAAAAALLEAALQPPTPPMHAASAMSLLGSVPSVKVSMPSSHVNGVDEQMAATMRLLTDLSSAGGQQHHPCLQSVSSMPVPAQHQNFGNSDVQQALHLIGQLQQLVEKANSVDAGNGAGSTDLNSVLLNMLPQVLMKVGGGSQMEGVPPAPLFSYPSAPIPTSFWHPSAASSPHSLGLGLGGSPHPPPKMMMMPIGSPSKASGPHQGSPGPAEIHNSTRRACGTVSSCSSYLSDGTNSPTLSHHSDEGIRPQHSYSLESCGLGLAQQKRQHLLGAFDSLPVSLEQGDDDHEDLINGMSGMSGASAMIASLSQLVASDAPCGDTFPRFSGEVEV